MKVLVLPSWYKNAENPVSGTFFEEQARALKRAGADVEIHHFSFLPFSSSVKGFDLLEKDDGLDTRRTGIKAALPRLTGYNYRKFGEKAARLAEDGFKKNGKPDLIHAHSVFWGGIAANYISRATGVPYVITEHLTNFSTGGITSITDIAIAKKVFSEAAANIVVSSAFRKDIASFLGMEPGNFIVIGNMVDEYFFSDVRPLPEKKSGEFSIFTNSFITERKNIHALIGAFAGFVKVNPGANLRIGGRVSRKEDLWYQESLLQLVNAYGLSEQVVFLGQTEKKTILEELQRCHLFALTSTYETFGVAIAEALAAGRPVMTTDSGGPSDIMTSEFGYMCNEFTAEDILKGMMQIHAEYDKFDAIRISKACHARFSQETIIPEILSVYNKAIK